MYCTRFAVPAGLSMDSLVEAPPEAQEICPCAPYQQSDFCVRISVSTQKSLNVWDRTF